MVMRHFGGGIGHSSRVLPHDSDSESSSDSDSSMGSESESDPHSGEEEEIEAISEPDNISMSSKSSTASHDNDPLDSEKSDLDTEDDGYDSLWVAIAITHSDQNLFTFHHASLKLFSLCCELRVALPTLYDWNAICYLKWNLITALS